MNPDRIIDLSGAPVQHGPGSDRVYIMGPGEADPAKLVVAAEALALQEGYGKIFARLPSTAASPFQESGFILEASVPDMFGPLTDGYFLCKYLHAERMRETEDRILARERARDLAASAGPKQYPRIDVRLAAPADLDDLASLYGLVFPVYPFPVQDSAFLREEQESGAAVYFLIREEGRLIAAASYEPNREYGYAEMTDFATLPETRGRGFASGLLHSMESHAADSGIRVAYTIARSESVGMNMVFGRAGYTFGGALINNTLIGESIESMHVWYKKL